MGVICHEASKVWVPMRSYRPKTFPIIINTLPTTRRETDSTLQSAYKLSLQV